MQNSFSDMASAYLLHFATVILSVAGQQVYAYKLRIVLVYFG